MSNTPTPSSVNFVITGTPVAKGRARFRNAGDFVQTYTPAKTRAYEALVSSEARKIMKGALPYDGPVKMSVRAFIRIPVSWTNKRRRSAAEGREYPVSRPDIDNYVKAALDGCNQIIFNDDSQVIMLLATKRYSDLPRLEISVSPLKAGA